MLMSVYPSVDNNIENTNLYNQLKYVFIHSEKGTLTFQLLFEGHSAV